MDDAHDDAQMSPAGIGVMAIVAGVLTVGYISHLIQKGIRLINDQWRRNQSFIKGGEWRAR